MGSGVKCLCSAGLRPDAGASLRDLHGEVSAGRPCRRALRGRIGCLRSGGEGKGGEAISHWYFQPLKCVKRPCEKGSRKPGFEWGEESDVCPVAGNCTVVPGHDFGVSQLSEPGDFVTSGLSEFAFSQQLSKRFGCAA